MVVLMFEVPLGHGTQCADARSQPEGGKGTPLSFYSIGAEVKPKGALIAKPTNRSFESWQATYEDGTYPTEATSAVVGVSPGAIG